MKKSLLFGMSLVIGVSMSAQQSNVLINPKIAKQTVPYSPKARLITDKAPVAGNQASKKSTPAPSVHNVNANAVQIGETQYDLQTNSSIGTRIVHHPDGTISAVWTICPTGGPNYTPRGTGYNYFDGSKWLYPDTVTHDVINRLETIRTGFPSIGTLGNNHSDIVIAHATSNYTLEEGTNMLKGGMPFTFFQTNATIPRGSSGGAIWPRIAIGGPNDSTVHCIANYSDTFAIMKGVKQPLVYSRSLDGGATWDTIAITLPKYDSTQQLFGGGEDYAIAAKGNNVAIVAGGLGNHLALWTSTDNGAHFSRQLVDSFPYVPDYSTDPNVVFGNDTIPTNDGSMDVMYDAGGNIHVTYALGKVGRDATGAGVFVPGTIGLIYWNNITNTKVNIPITLAAVDADQDGFYTVAVGSTDVAKCRYGNNSLLNKPSMGMDASGNIFIIFSLPTDNDSTADSQPFRDIWAVTSADGGNTWSEAVNITNSLQIEDAFACLAKDVDGYLHIVYQEDVEPGTALTNMDGDAVNNINYLKVDKSLLTIGIKQVQGSNDLFSVGQNFPNPLNGQTMIPVTLKRQSDVSVSITNIMGQNVLNMSTGNLNPGYHNINVDATKLNSGIYFYTVKAGNFSVTKRMIVEN